MPQKHKRARWASLGVVVAVAIVAVVCWMSIDSGGATDDPSATTERSLVNDPLMAGSLRFDQLEQLDLGHSLTYAINWNSKLLIGRDELAETIVSMELSGHWLIQVRKENEDGSRLFQAKLSQLKFLANSNQETEDNNGRIEIGLRKPIYFTLDERGQILNVRLHQSLPVLAQSVQKGLLSLVQFVSATDHSQQTWQTLEKDTTGIYSATYRREPEAGLFLKSKTHYQHVSASKSGNGGHADVIASKGRFTFLSNDPSVIKSVDVQEIVALKEMQLFPETRNESIFQLSLIGIKERPWVDEDLSSELAEFVHTSIDAPATKEAVAYEMDMVKIAGLQFEDMLATLRELSPEDAKKRGRVFQRLGSLFRHDSSAVKSAIQLIEDGDAHASFLIDALAFSGGPESQIALLDLFENESIAASHGMRIFRGLGRANTPIDQSIDLHLQLLDDESYGEQAYYGLGSLTGRLTSADAATIDKVEDLLVDQLNESNSESAQIVALRAMGNSGLSVFKNSIFPYLDDPSENLRSEAIRALSGMSGLDVVESIARKATTDSDYGVKSNAVSALVQHLSSDFALEALANVCQNETEPILRKQATMALARRIDSTIAKSTFEWMVGNEPNEEIRNLAQQAL